MMKQISRLAHFSIIVIAAIAAGCASKPPPSIARIPAENPALARVLLDLDHFTGSEVRWGGEITRVENRATETWVEIVRRELRDNGRPESSGKSDGRFIASFKGFVDPVVYEVGRSLTVIGTIENQITRPIGEYDYRFPVVVVESSYLWKDVTVAPGPYYPGPWWYYDYHYYTAGPHHYRGYH
jgi:outer membrane lipoprotein